MTANAMQGDITKPIRVDELIGALEKVSQRKEK